MFTGSFNYCQSEYEVSKGAKTRNRYNQVNVPHQAASVNFCIQFSKQKKKHMFIILPMISTFGVIYAVLILH